MSAREVMAKRVSDVWGPTLGQAISTAVMAALIEAGYRVLAPGEVDAETVERCAALAETYEHRMSAWQLDSIPWFAKGAATAIRSLGRRA